MALTKATVREILSKAGVDADHLQSAVSQIIDGHVSSIEALRDEINENKTEIEKYRKEADKITDLNQQLEDANKKIEGMKDLQQKADDFEKLQKEFNDYKAEQDKKALDTKKSTVLKEMLKDMRIESEDGVKLGLKWYAGKVELDDDGKIKNDKELRDEIKDDLGSYISHTKKQGAKTSNPPANNGKGMTKEEIDKIEDTKERQKAMAENLDLYGIE